MKWNKIEVRLNTEQKIDEILVSGKTLSIYDENCNWNKNLHFDGTCYQVESHTDLQNKIFTTVDKALEEFLKP